MLAFLCGPHQRKTPRPTGSGGSRSLQRAAGQGTLRGESFVSRKRDQSHAPAPQLSKDFIMGRSLVFARLRRPQRSISQCVYKPLNISSDNDPSRFFPFGKKIVPNEVESGSNISFCKRVTHAPEPKLWNVPHRQDCRRHQKLLHKLRYMERILQIHHPRKETRNTTYQVDVHIHTIHTTLTRWELSPASLQAQNFLFPRLSPPSVLHEQNVHVQ